MILNINSIPEVELTECYNNRMNQHRHLVNSYYNILTDTDTILLHDIDKDDKPIWKYYYYCRENNLELPEYLQIQWMNEDYLHRLNSNHHIECLLSDNELNWIELVSDFFAVNRKHNRSSIQLLDIVYNNYYYAYDYCKYYINLY